MKLLTLKRPPATAPVSPPVSIDALIAVVGGREEQLLQRFPEVARDFMDRPMIAFEHAQQAHREWLAAQDRDYFIRLDFERYQEDRIKRRREVAEAACAAARAAHVGGNRGGEESQRFMQAQWTAQRAALAAFDEAEPQIVLSEFRRQFREKEKTG